jgi:hypothetical protein
VKGDSLVGTFDAIEDANSAGVRSFGVQPFLVRQLGHMPDEVQVPALTLGVLRARS